MIPNDQRTSLLIPSQLPGFIRDEADSGGAYENFVHFIQAYYEWMEENGNVIDRTKNISQYTDIDATTSEFIDYFLNDFLAYFPKDSLTNKQQAIKVARQLYQSKGTISSYQLLFRMLFNSDFDIFYTKDAVLKASSGIWYVPKSLKLSTNDTRFLDIKNLRILGETSKSIATIENSIYARNKTEVFISNIERLFNSGEFVRIVDSNNQDVIINGTNLRAKIVGQISQINVAKDILGNALRGSNYGTGDPVVVYGGLNTEITNPVGAQAVVGQTTSGSIQSITVTSGGFGYRLSPNTVINFGGLDASAQIPTAVVASIDPSASNSANVTYLPQEIISYKSSVVIGNSNYFFANGYTLNVNTSLYSVNANTFKISETLYQGPSGNPTFSGVVSRWDSSNGIIKFSSASGTPTRNANVISSSTSNVANVRSYYTSNANTAIVEALTFISFETFPISSVLVNSQGGGIRTQPTVVADTLYPSDIYDATKTGNLRNIGILGPIQINNGGVGYRANDRIVFSGGSGYGAFANVTNVSSTGAITEIKYVQNNSSIYPLGGQGFNYALPTITVNSSNTAAYNASLSVTSTLGDGAVFDTTLDRVGTVTSIVVTEPGEDYIGAPTISLKVIDLLVQGADVLNLPNKTMKVYQGTDINTASFYANVDSIAAITSTTNINPALTDYLLRIYNYQSLPSTSQVLKFTNSNIQLTIDPQTVSANAFYTGSPSFQDGIRIYGDGNAKADASFLNGLVIGQGQYLNSQGQPSSYDILQSQNFNNFTYQITVEKEISKYREALLNLLHPTGMKVIGRFKLVSEGDNNNTLHSVVFNKARTLYYYTNDNSSNAVMRTDFSNTSTNTVIFYNIGVGTNIANIIFANSSIFLGPTNGPDVYSKVKTVDYANNKIVLTEDIFLTYSNVAHATGSIGSSTINITSIYTDRYNIVNNGVYSNTAYPLKDIIFAGDQILVANNTAKTVQSINYVTGTITLTTNLTANTNSNVAVSRTFSAGGTVSNKQQVKIYGTVGTQYYPELVTENGDSLITEDGDLILLD
jgi:hypothetical protein